MKPDKVSESLRRVAAKVEASRRPSVSKVAAAVRLVLAAVEGQPVTVELHGDTYEVANPGEEAFTERLWAFQFGSSGTARVLVWADSIEDGLEKATEYLRDHGKPGYFESDDSMKERYEEALREVGGDEEKAHEKAEEGLTYTESGYVPSHEWWVDEVIDEEDIEAAKAASPSDEDEGAEPAEPDLVQQQA